MNKTEKKESKELIAQDKVHVINFLRAYNLKVKGNRISMLFSDSFENPVYKNLWNLEFEPALVKVEFEILNLPNKRGEPQEILQILLNKIVERDFPENPDNISEYLRQTQNNYCQQSIEIKNNKIKLIGSIDYSS